MRAVRYGLAMAGWGSLAGREGAIHDWIGLAIAIAGLAVGLWIGWGRREVSA